MALLSSQRKTFHRNLLKTVISADAKGVLSVADSASELSKSLSKRAFRQIGPVVTSSKIAGQRSGRIFEDICKDFLEQTFLHLQHLRPGKFQVHKGTSIAVYKQYEHLSHLSKISADNPELATAIGQDYLIKPDIIISRKPESDEEINQGTGIVSTERAYLSPLRATNSDTELLHATISCKFTIRSDRAQNARSESLNVIRNRKGHTPHIAVITADPLPSRIASLALGTGDIDCVYHAFLDELVQAASEARKEDSVELLKIMIEGNRLRDISDLPLDLAI